MFKTMSSGLLIVIGVGVFLLSFAIHCYLYVEPSHLILALKSLPGLFSYPTIYGLLAGAVLWAVGMSKMRS